MANSRNERKGELAESFVERKFFDEASMKLLSVDKAWDFEWYGLRSSDSPDLRLEVKSCEVSRKWIECNDGNKKMRVGVFEFVRECSRKELIEHDAWVCFVVTYNKEHLLMGLLPARLLGLDHRKGLSIHEVALLKPLSLKEFVERI